MVAKRRSVRKVNGEFKLFVGGKTPFGTRKFKIKKKAQSFLRNLKE